MRTRYYVLPAGNQYRVLREGKPQGLHASEAQAMASAVFMASVEASRSLSTVELFVADERGILVQDRLIGPEADEAAPGRRAQPA